jgi:lysyl-tRNA synthetase class 2
MRSDDRNEWPNLLLAMKVESELGCEGPEILYDYPESQAALAKLAVRETGQRVAERFELYWHGVELANGYHELTDAEELRQRLVAVNEARRAEGRERLPLPESLLAAMEKGLPASAGCALGFDRLAMLACGAKSIDEVIAFPAK